MERTNSFIYILIITLFLLSCNDKKENKNNKILAERIQYDVLIKTPDVELDWWVQNIEGSKRESFIRTILDLAYSGKVKAYDYDNNPLTSKDVKKIDNYPETFSIPDPVIPNKMNDTVVMHKLDIQKITKVRFLEEWYLDEKSCSFEKKVIGIMLMKENYGDSMELRGYTPLFWLYFDNAYPAKINKVYP